jgi:hypothetical protein
LAGEQGFSRFGHTAQLGCLAECAQLLQMILLVVRIRHNIVRIAALFDNSMQKSNSMCLFNHSARGFKENGVLLLSTSNDLLLLRYLLSIILPSLRVIHPAAR